MKHCVFILSFLTLFLLCSCSKDSSPTSYNNSKTDTTKTDTTISSDGLYWPNDKGNNWHYTGAQEEYITVTGDTTIDGKKYSVLNINQNGSYSNAYLYEQNGDIIVRSFMVGDNSEMKMMNSNASIGTKWDNFLTINTFNCKYEFIMTSKGISYQANSKTYSNVIKLTLNLYMEYAGNYILATTSYYYFAKGVGLIKYESDNGDLSLIDYYVRK